MMSLFGRLRDLFTGPDASLTAAPENSLPEVLLESDRLRDSGQLEKALELLDTRAPAGKDQAEFQRRVGLLLFWLHRYPEAVAALQSAVSISPTDGESFKFLAGTFSALGNAAQALKAARRAAALLPRDAQIRNLVGAMCADVGAIEEAIEHFHVALEIKPDDLLPLANLEILNARFGAAGFQRLTPPGIAALREKVIEDLNLRLQEEQLTPVDADLLCTLTGNRDEYFVVAEEIERQFGARTELPTGLEIGLAVVCQNRGDLSGAIRHFEAAARDDADAKVVKNGLGSLYVIEGGARWFEGWQRLSLTYRQLNPANYPGSVPQWTGSSLGGGKLFVHVDQGVGDAIIGSRFLEHLAERGLPAVLWLPSHLREILPLPAAGIEVVESVDWPDPRALGCSAASGLLELIAPLGIARSAIGEAPRLKLTLGASRSWRDRLAHLPGRKIALVAFGNPDRIDDWLRSIDVRELAPLLKIPGISLIDLSIDARPERGELAAMSDIFDAGSLIKSFSDTAALLNAVDAVIAIDCATAHLAASLGKPTWVFQPTMLDWRWQIGEELSPWWPEVRMIKADRPGSWVSGIDRLCETLSASNWKS